KPLIGVDHVHAHLYSVVLESNQTPAAAHAIPNHCHPERSEGSGNSSDARSFASLSMTGIQMPAVGLVCSGGHTALYRVNDWLNVELIGSTIDDAVGEAYDKVAAILGLGYPGGPVIDRLAQYGDPKAIDFPRTLLGRGSLDFSFSGLKTSVLYRVRGVPQKGQ